MDDESSKGSGSGSGSGQVQPLRSVVERRVPQHDQRLNRLTPEGPEGCAEAMDGDHVQPRTKKNEDQPHTHRSNDRQDQFNCKKNRVSVVSEGSSRGSYIGSRLRHLESVNHDRHPQTDAAAGALGFLVTKAEDKSQWDGEPRALIRSGIYRSQGVHGDVDIARRPC